MRHARTWLAAAVVVGAFTVAAQPAAAQGYVYAPPSLYVAPPVVYYDPIAVAPQAYYEPVLVHQPVVPTYYAPAAYYAPAGYYAPAAYYYRDTGRRARYEYRVYTPFGVEKHKYKLDRRDGEFEYDYDFDR
ncbi:MAG: hypothetical protein WD069_03965 [Planctomycetales bacterium]